MSFIRDLFMSVNNAGWELARVLAAWAVVSYTAAFIGVFIRGSQPMDFSAIGVGFAAVLAGAGALIFAKDSARTAAVSQVAKDETAANPPPVQPPVGVPLGTESDPLHVAGTTGPSPPVQTEEARP